MIIVGNDSSCAGGPKTTGRRILLKDFSLNILLRSWERFYFIPLYSPGFDKNFTSSGSFLTEFCQIFENLFKKLENLR